MGFEQGRSDLCLITFEAIVWRKVSRMQTRRQGGEGEAGSGWGLGGREAGGRQMLPWAVATPSGSGDAQAVLQALSAGTGACEK